MSISNGKFDDKNSTHPIAETDSRHLLRSDLLRLRDHLLKNLQNIVIDLGTNEKVNK